MFECTDVKLNKKLFNRLYDINQELKVIYNPETGYDPTMYFVKGKVYYFDENSLPQLFEGFIEKDPKLDYINDFFFNNTFSIKCSTIFNFKKDHKEDIQSIIIEKHDDINVLCISTSLFLLESRCSDTEIKRILSKCKQFTNRFSDEVFIDMKLEYDSLVKLFTKDKKNDVKRFILDLDKGNVFIDNDRDNDSNRETFIEISLANKFILGLDSKENKKTGEIIYSDVVFDLYAGDDEDIYLITISVFNPLIVLKQYYIVTDVALQ